MLRAADAPLSIAAVADELSIHPNTARFHLDALLRTGQVESVETGRTKPGRPPTDVPSGAGYGSGGTARLPDVGRDPRRRTGRPAQPCTSGRRGGEHLGEAHRRKRGPQPQVGRRSAHKPASRSGVCSAKALWRTRCQGEIGLHNCPFLELAQTRRDVVCPVHMGVMKGALSAWDAPITVSELTPFAEPDLCVVHLAPAEKAS